MSVTQVKFIIDGDGIEHSAPTDAFPLDDMEEFKEIAEAMLGVHYCDDMEDVLVSGLAPTLSMGVCATDALQEHLGVQTPDEPFRQVVFHVYNGDRLLYRSPVIELACLVGNDDDGTERKGVSFNPKDFTKLSDPLLKGDWDKLHVLVDEMYPASQRLNAALENAPEKVRKDTMKLCGAALLAITSTLKTGFINHP